MARVITDARDSFEAIKQEMDTIKSISEMELTAIKDALRKVENDIRSTAANVGLAAGPAAIGPAWSGSK